jgi:hypothetical protein
LETGEQSLAKMSDILTILLDEKSLAIFEMVAIATEEQGGIDDACINDQENRARF